MNLRKKTGKNSAKPSRQKSAVPRTAQQSIPMQRMFEDGTCRVKRLLYADGGISGHQLSAGPAGGPYGDL